MRFPCSSMHLESFAAQITHLGHADARAAVVLSEWTGRVAAPTVNQVQRGARTPAVQTRVPRLFWSEGQDVAQLPQ